MRTSSTGGFDSVRDAAEPSYSQTRGDPQWRRDRLDQEQHYRYHHYADRSERSPEDSDVRYRRAPPSAVGHEAVGAPSYQRYGAHPALPPTRPHQIQATSLPIVRADHGRPAEPPRHLPRSQSDRALVVSRAVEREHGSFSSTSSLHSLPAPGFPQTRDARYGSSLISSNSGAQYGAPPTVLRRSPPSLPAPYSTTHRQGAYLPATAAIGLPGPYRAGNTHALYRQHDDLEAHEAAAGPSDVGNKRFRISRACQHCKTRKTRCDAIGILAHHANAERRRMDPYGYEYAEPPAAATSEAGSPGEGSSSATAPDMIVVQPCTNCLRANIECVYSRKQLKRGPSKGYVKQLEKRLDSLEQSLIERGGPRDEDDKEQSDPAQQETIREDATKAKPEERLANLENLLQSAPESSPSKRPLDLLKRELDASPTDSQEPPIPSELTSCLTARLYGQADSGLSILVRPFFRTILHRSLPILASKRTSSDSQHDTLSQNRQRAVMLLLEPLTSVPSALAKHRAALQRVVGEAMSAKTTISPSSSPQLMMQPGRWPAEVVRGPTHLVDQLAANADAASVQAESTLLCYVDSLRLGEPSLLLLTVAARHMRRHGKAAKRQQSVLRALDCWHAAAMGTPIEVHLEGSQGTIEGAEDLNSSVTSLSPTADDVLSGEILRSSYMLQIYHEEIDRSEGDATKLSQAALSNALHQAGLDEAGDAAVTTTSSAQRNDKAIRTVLRSILDVHHQLLCLPRTSRAQDNLNVARINAHLRTAIDLIDLLRREDGAGVILQTFIGPAVLAMIAARLAWTTLALLCLSHQEAADDSLDRQSLRENVQRSTRLFVDLSLDAHGLAEGRDSPLQDEQAPATGTSVQLKTKACSLAPVCSRIALYAQHWLDVFDRHDSSGVRDDDDAIESWRKQADALAHGVHTHGALGLVLTSTGTEAAWQLWKQHHSESLRSASSH